MQLSKNFTLKELTHSDTATRKGLDNTPTSEALANLERLVNLILQPLRDKLGPIRINSGYRSYKVNKAVGGANNSQHTKGQAADIVFLKEDLYKAFEYIKDSNLPYDQLILEFDSWIHISICELGNKPRRQVLEANKVNGKTVYTTIK